jgi:hypothetical protein
MAIVFIPKMSPVPKGATREDRERMFRAYIEKLNAANVHLKGSPITYARRLFRIRP